ncbi:DUF4188 domain-containing protein [Microlunatus sp. Y2014]|uniref:DUF4188 domain-containing protein n=1 Tax=Microlunatus sp. Y2014 TaxID=3418488 RepID=UPI003DA73763
MRQLTTHTPTDDLVVFHIGMRINKPWRPDAWLPTFFAMPPMLKELSRDPDSGMLDYRLLMGERGVTVVLWFRSADHVYRYANNNEQQHRPAWLAFLRRGHKVPGAVGIWHETYEIARAESFYGDMPTTGLARAVGVEPISSKRRTAGDRLQRRSSPRDVPVAKSALG